MAAVLGNGPFTINDWRVDPSLNRISRGEDFVKIDPQNMKVLELLASRPGEVFSQTEIEQSAWPDVIVTPNSVYQSIAHLRRALGDDKSKPQYIETIARKGYRCIADITVIGGMLGNERSQPQTRNPIPIGLAVVTLVALGTSLVLWNQDSVDNSANRSELADETSHLSENSHLARMQIARELGDAAASKRQPEEALHHYKVALTHARESAVGPNPIVAEVLTRMARVYSSQDQPHLAQSTVREALEILRTTAPPMNPEWIEAHDVLAEALSSLGEHSESIASARTAVSLSEVLHGAESLSTMNRRATLARSLLESGQASEAEILTRRILSTFIEQHTSAENEEIAYFTTMLARSLYHQARYEESMLEAQRSVTILTTVSRPDDPHLGAALQYLADAHLRMGNAAEAETTARKCVHILRANNAASWRLARTMSTLGEALLMQGMKSEAEEHIKYAAQVLNKGGQTLERLAWEENERRLALLYE